MPPVQNLVFALRLMCADELSLKNGPGTWYYLCVRGGDSDPDELPSFSHTPYIGDSGSAPKNSRCSIHTPNSHHTACAKSDLYPHRTHSKIPDLFVMRKPIRILSALKFYCQQVSRVRSKMQNINVAPRCDRRRAQNNPQHRDHGKPTANWSIKN